MNENKESKMTRTFAMYKLAKQVGLDKWTGYGDEHVDMAVDYIAKQSIDADVVHVFGTIPPELAMKLAIRLYGMSVGRLEWAPYNGRKNIIFSAGSE